MLFCFPHDPVYNGPQQRAICMKQDFAMSEIKIRLEAKEDYPVVENMIREAFWNVNVPRASEHYLAHLL